MATEQPAENEEIEKAEQAEDDTTTASGDADGEEESETETAPSDATSEAFPADQAGIGTAYPLGTELSTLLAHYGQPTYDEFFLGARLVVFNEQDGYFLDGNDTVSGFLIANPDVDIFGARIGMEFEEIDAVFGKEGEVFFDESETQDYISLYYFEHYRITFYADTGAGASQYAIVIPDK